jgi:YebC/PmpR family DNA-binding regulatory protein
MSGHNKWSKIKHKKAATDAKKSKIFGKLVQLIQVEAKKSNGDIEAPGLRTAIEKARKENMPNSNIEKAIKKANDIGNVTEVIFEAYGPGGAGLIITGLTDNNNRTSAEVRHVLTKNNSSLGAQGSVSWNFTFDQNKGIYTPNSTIDLSEKLTNLVEALEDLDDVQEVFVNAE